jgi:lambda family phage portal protein
VATKLDDMNEYSRAEVEAARASSYYFATIKTPESATAALADSADPSLQPTMTIESGLIQSLAPGEELVFHSPNRPNAALDPFMRAMLREISAGVGVSYESLSRDYSQSNYSSSRLALMDDRDTWRHLQRWWIRSFREPLHRIWLQQAVFAGAVPAVPVGAYALDRPRYEAVLFKCRGWSWIDPAKEQQAFADAVRNGFTTVTDVIAQTGGGLDIEDVIATRKRELQMLEEAGINVETTVPDVPEPVAAPPPQAEADPPNSEDDEEDTDEPPARLVSFGGKR